MHISIPTSKKPPDTSGGMNCFIQLQIFIASPTDAKPDAQAPFAIASPL
jgi:hypothetical protein